MTRSGDSSVRMVSSPRADREVHLRGGAVHLRLLFAAFCACALLAVFSTPASAHPAHVFADAFGSAGSGAGQFSVQPFVENERQAGSGIAVNQETGAIYLADTGNRRVDEFDAEGNFVRAFGWGVETGAAELQVCTSTTGCRTGISGSSPGEFEEPTFIAVDNSGTASQGDVYVADSRRRTITKFNPDGTLVGSWGNQGPAGAADGQLGNFSAFTPSFPTGILGGIAVGSTGDLWLLASTEIYSGNGEMLEFTAAGGLADTWSLPGLGLIVGGIAVDSSGDIYVPNFTDVLALTSAGVEIGSVESSSSNTEAFTGLAVDSGGDLYTDHGNPQEQGHGTHINHFAPATCDPAAAECTPAEVFGTREEVAAGRLTDAQALAVGPAHLVYAIERKAAKILAYKQVVQPDVTTGEVSNLAQSTVTLNGEVDPDGVELSECYFEYGETLAYGQKAACAETPAQIGIGHAAVAVHVDLSGLEPSFYHYRLVAQNGNRPERGVDHAFGASIDLSSVESVGATEAIFTALINPQGIDTTCQVQIVPEESFTVSGFEAAMTVPCDPSDLGSGSVGQSVTATVLGLSPETAYRFRFVATSAAHTVEGAISTVYTYASPLFTGCPNEALRGENRSSLLPDCRAYEQVSPSGTAAVYLFPVPSGGSTGGYVGGDGIPTQSADDGEEVVYNGEPADSGSGEGTGNNGPGEGDQQFARRGGDGWVVADISPLASAPGTIYEAFSPDLSHGMLLAQAGERPLAEGVDPTCSLLYERDNATGTFTSFFPSGGSSCQPPFFVGASAQNTHRLFESAAKLPTEGSQTQTAGGQGHENIYDASGGALHLINVLPGVAHKAIADATIGYLATEREAELGQAYGGEIVNGVGIHTPSIDTTGAVSSDGSRIFWTDLQNGVVYVRENDTAEPSAESGGHCTEPELACTVQISAGSATYETATPGGRFSYYIEAGRLFRFDLERFNTAIGEGQTVAEADSGAREPLTPSGAGVQGVVGVNSAKHDEAEPEGEYLYFVAEGALAQGAEARQCREGETIAERTEELEGALPAEKGCNLYLLHGGATRFVVPLSADDDSFPGYGTTQGDWRAVSGFRSAELTPDGLHLTFLSNLRLTSYDTRVPGGGKCGSGSLNSAPTACPEVYIYDAGSAELACASCAPGGTPPMSLSSFAQEAATYLPGDLDSITHMRRWVSADGDRVFFDSVEPLLPSDTNDVMDVYEWERAGSGSCKKGSPLDGGGCLYELSGSGRSPSYLLDTDETGRNAFIISRTALAPSDTDEKPDVYDIREGGGFPAPVEPQVCEAGGCRGPSPSPPSGSTAATAHFGGAADQTPTTPCRKGQTMRHGRCVAKKPKHHHPKPKRHHDKKAHKHGGGK